MLKNLLKAAGALALAVACLGTAWALDVDQNKIVPYRQFDYQMVHYYRLTLNYNDPGVGTGQLFGGLPNNAYILSIDAYVTTAFNAGTTNPITIGVTKTPANEIVASGITNTAATVSHLTTAAGLGLAVTGNPSNQTSNGVPLYALYAPTGTAATAGQVTIVIAYVPNNDL